MNADAATREETRRGTRILGISFGVLLLLFLAASLERIWQDEPPPDTRDLAVAVEKVPNEENAYAVLLATAQRLEAAKPWASDDTFFTILSGRAWDAEKVTRWVAADPSMPAEVLKASALPRTQGPLTGFNGAHARALRQLFQISALRARLLAKSGQRDEALAWLAANLRAAQKIENAQGGMLIWFVGNAAHGVIRSEIERLVLADDFSPANGRLLIATLEETRPGTAGIANAIRREHAEIKSMLAGMGSQPLLKPNITERLHAEYIRTVLGFVDANWTTLEARMPNIEDFLAANSPKWNPDNRTGRKWITEATPDLQGLLGRRLHFQSAISITQALIALRLYEIEHDALPAKLADLVPDYLAKEPLDYFDGHPIRYSRDFLALWSTGKDGFTVTSPEIPWRKDPPPHLKIVPPAEPAAPPKP